MDKLIACALECIPAHIDTEVQLVIFAKNLNSGLESCHPGDWVIWREDLRKVVEQWPKNIEEVWSLVDSLDIGVRISDGAGHFYSDPEMAEEFRHLISNQHLLYLSDHMVPGAFLTLLFPKGFPLHLKKLHLRHPLIVNCTEVLHMLRNCQNLKDLSLFVIFNMEKGHEGHGLPPELETLELFESGGTILPTFYGGLSDFRYTFVGEPSTDDMNIVRYFIERNQFSQLDLNLVSTSDFMYAMEPYVDSSLPPATSNLGRYMLKKLSYDHCDHFRFGGRSGQTFCSISKRASHSLREYILNLAKSSR